MKYLVGFELIGGVEVEACTIEQARDRFDQISIEKLINVIEEHSIYDILELNQTDEVPATNP